jgi:hypothetical protein
VQPAQWCGGTSTRREVRVGEPYSERLETATTRAVQQIDARGLAMQSVCAKLSRARQDSSEEAMPAARKTTRRPSAARARDGAAPSRSPATRRELQRRVVRVEKLLDDAGEALQLLSKDMGRGAGDAYKELTRSARALRRDAQRTNKRTLQDFDKLRAAVTRSGTTGGQATRRASRSSATRTATGSSPSTRATRPSRAASTAKRTKG